MKRIIRLTESDLARIVRRVINEEAGTGQMKIPNEARFLSELRGENTPWLRLTAMVGGNANKLSGNPDVVEFDARLAYVKNYQGEDAAKMAGKVMNVKAYFGCKTGLFTAKNPSDETTQKFGQYSQGPDTSGFEDWVLTSGLCPKGSYNSQEDLRSAFRN